MKKLWIYIGFILIITIVLPTVLVKTSKFISLENKIKIKEIKKDEKKAKKEEFDGYIKVYDTRTQEVIKLSLEDYVKGVVAAEMPGEFHTEALKAQAVASRTYALHKMNKFDEGHPDHSQAPLCTGVHCQAFLSIKELEEVHSKKWINKYWSKIEEAVESTAGEVVYYEDEIVEPLYHSTSGGMTEDAKDVFASESPYLKSVSSPYEEGAPKFKDVATFTADDFIKKMKTKYPSVNIKKDNFPEKIKLVERSESGRVKKIMIDGQVVNGSEIREIFNLNSTNFKIIYNPKSNMIDIETIGYGHGVGMSQWGANGMAKKGKKYKDILKHYYTGVDVRKYKKD
ncbi:stage II sporulation protein D [Anaerosalibacter massiliensis]|uniref:Stage II sporulation protein D n=1 Tax=Anaerosalibacter massiliensis TaxID=1347392 RepID=A0A9X2MJ72_9FIRM|nr:stage II sporulation protein D [Anaerosalibacter massiliensis]MCR2044709.1 stage II sporulation protein D [Anaerosalibacter massiliensis]